MGCHGDPVKKRAQECVIDVLACLQDEFKSEVILFHTWLTPPEFSVHIANLFASPTVSPSKSLKLSHERS